MPLFWLNVAVGLYGVGLVFTLLALTRRGELMSRLAVPVVSLGIVFHFVSLVEAVLGDGALASWHQSESILALLLIAAFLIVYFRYRTASPGVFLLPIGFLLALASSLGQEPQALSSPLLRSTWVLVHITLMFVGYAALFLSFGASILYLIQERGLKSKRQTVSPSWLPPLETIDEIGYRALMLGFPFMTTGLIAGSVLASANFGAAYFLDPKILLSLLMWVAYVVLLYGRWNNGWRGRRAAYLATFALLFVVGTWAANYFSQVHRFPAP
jgi:ABC-type uncharacterized transport system permease subunit